jgi:dihydrofolate reductase
VRVSIIVAAATNHVIGVQGALPWHISEDLKRFRALTTGKPIVMGRLTYESIGKPLPQRRNIIISRQAGYRATGCEVVTSPVAALDLAAGAEEIMVIGGGRIYTQLLPLADRIYLTRVHARPEGDAFFPELDHEVWRTVSIEEHAATDTQPLAYSFEILERTMARSADR